MGEGGLPVPSTVNFMSLQDLLQGNPGYSRQLGPLGDVPLSFLQQGGDIFLRKIINGPIFCLLIGLKPAVDFKILVACLVREPAAAAFPGN